MTEEQHDQEGDEGWSPIIGYSGTFTQFIDLNGHIGFRIQVVDGECKVLDVAYRDGEDWRLPESTEEILHIVSDLAVILANQFSAVPVIVGTAVGVVSFRPPSAFDGISLS